MSRSPAVAEWVVNSSPLISLAKIGRLDLIQNPARQLLIPRAVADEIRQGPFDDPARRAVDGELRAFVHDAVTDEDVLAWSLGAGESAVLSLARSRDSIAVLDDFEARSAARVFGIPCTGTLGVVIQAAKEGRIPSATPWIRALRAAGLRLSDQAVAGALRAALGEDWQASEP